MGPHNTHGKEGLGLSTISLYQLLIEKYVFNTQVLIYSRAQYKLHSEPRTHHKGAVMPFKHFCASQHMDIHTYSGVGMVSKVRSQS